MTDLDFSHFYDKFTYIKYCILSYNLNNIDKIFQNKIETDIEMVRTGNRKLRGGNRPRKPQI
jgi:hypothetical protein